MNNRKSQDAFEKAKRLMPGGVNSPVRAFGAVERSPLFIKAARGSKIYDLDDNEYIDYVCSWGPLILGHAHPAVVEAVRNAAQRGTSFGAPTAGETVLAEKIAAAVPSIKKLRLVNSGTEAVMTAIRLARAYTGKNIIIKMTGCYHGHSDSLLVQAGSGLAQAATPSSAGVPAGIAALTVSIPYNDNAAVEKAFELHAGQVAAVLVEPVAANMGVIPPESGYLRKLRELTSENDSLLIFDEVITGFRLAPGGAQQLYGITPDLTCLGKVIGGGMPLAAFGGKAEIMDQLAPLGPVYQAGTLSGNPVAVAAAVATLNELTDQSYQRLESNAAHLEQGLQQAARKANVTVTINRVGSLLSVFFTDKCVHNFGDAKAADAGQFRKFFAGMLNSGVYLAPSPFEAMFLSLAHTKEDIEKTVKAAENAFSGL